jgi:hypothetical protein
MPRRQAISHRQAKRSAQPAAGLDLVLALHRLLAGVGNLLGPKSVRDPRSQMESIFPCWNASAQSSGITSCSTASISSPEARPPAPSPKKGRS